MSTGFGRELLSLGANQVVAVATASADETLPGGIGVRRYLLSCNTDCYVKWGTGAQTATTAAGGFDLFMPAGLAIVVQVKVADDTIAAIRNSADGVLAIHEIVSE